MTRSRLGGTLLKSVSRSFFLSIRLLPRPLREPIGLAYLLARASDTIADSSAALVATRLHHLSAFERMIRSGAPAGLEELQREISSPHAGETALLANLGACIAWLASLDSGDRAAVTEVLEKIIRGQALDLERFGASGEIIALETAAELDEYTYLVAGCVGEFWTALCFDHLPGCATAEFSEMRKLGENFGKGLQLVNILRDSPEDLRNGRCYLPAVELRAAGVAPMSLAQHAGKAQPVFDRWLARAEAHLEEGFCYIAALRSARLRAACFLPWHLGVETLALMRAGSPLASAARIKVPRSSVRLALAFAVPVAFSNRALRGLHRAPLVRG